MIPSARLQFLTTADAPFHGDASAVFLGEGVPAQRIQARADAADLALIRPATALDPAAEGYWTADITALTQLRARDPNIQLVGLAQDRHSAMEMGEAGADLILFGHLNPLIVQGELELAQWWAEVAVVPCGCIVSSAGHTPFGEPGYPEFFLEIESS